MSTTLVHFVDVDHTMCEGGTDQLFPGIVEQFREWHEKGEAIFLFTCRHFEGPASDGSGEKWLQRFIDQGLIFDGWIHKPLADHYCWWDDKLLAAGHQVGLQKFPNPELGLWFSREEIADVLGKDSVQKLARSREVRR